MCLFVLTAINVIINLFQSTRCLFDICFSSTSLNIFFDLCLPGTFFILLKHEIVYIKKKYFQAGLIELLYDRFRLTIIICMVYFIFTTILHIWTLSIRWKDPLEHSWSTGLHVFYIFQRFGKFILLFKVWKFQFVILQLHLYTIIFINVQL